MCLFDCVFLMVDLVWCWMTLTGMQSWDCRASFTTLQQSYSKHMQKVDTWQNHMLTWWEGKHAINVNENTIQHTRRGCTHTDAHIPLGWIKDRKCESCQPIGDWVIEEFDSERNILLPWWWTRRNNNWVHKQRSRKRDILKEKLHGKRPASFKNLTNNSQSAERKDSATTMNAAYMTIIFSIYKHFKLRHIVRTLYLVNCFSLSCWRSHDSDKQHSSHKPNRFQ